MLLVTVELEPFTHAIQDMVCKYHQAVELIYGSCSLLLS